MQRVNLVVTATMLMCLALCPFAVFADEVLEDLDETMVVVDNSADLNARIDELNKVKDRGVSKEDWQDEEGDPAEQDAGDAKNTPLEDHFDNDPEELEDILEVDDDFEDGDEVDDDLASDSY